MKPVSHPAANRTHLSRISDWIVSESRIDSNFNPYLSISLSLSLLASHLLRGNRSREGYPSSAISM